MDASLKYQQVIEQFTLDDIAPPEQQALIDQPLPASGELVASNLALSDDSGTKIVSGVSFPWGWNRTWPSWGQRRRRRRDRAAGVRFAGAGFRRGHMGGVDLTRSPGP